MKNEKYLRALLLFMAEKLSSNDYNIYTTTFDFSVCPNLGLGPDLERFQQLSKLYDVQIFEDILSYALKQKYLRQYTIGREFSKLMLTSKGMYILKHLLLQEKEKKKKQSFFFLSHILLPLCSAFVGTFLYIHFFFTP